ncbi:MAG: hypothetical protein JXR58_11370 [Bacteroidales bacterium]|nr:hypothetical protein [Bacteroidales bacterium]
MQKLKKGGKTMNYDIKIAGEITNNGQIEFEKSNCDLNAIKQIEKQLIEKNNQNTFASIIGKWPGDEKWEDIINELD